MPSSIPIPTLRNLRCGHCKKFVTCGPVYVTPDSSILCGRCIRYAKQAYRNVAFEAIAATYVYPCYYWSKHCNKRLVWNEALEHERKCLFQSSCNVFCSRPGTYFKSDRKLPNTTEISLEHVTDEIIQNLKCVSCDLYLSHTPVYIFVDGKNICHRCTHANGVPKGAIRNLAYEIIANSIIFPCIYRFRGCTIRLQFGRDMWGHEDTCPYGQIPQKYTKKISTVTGKDGKERGVIETHSGHYWGTITPHSALFAPPKTKHNDGKIVTQELTEVMKRKQQEEVSGFDNQSMDSVMSRGTFDSIGDISRDNVSRDNVSRSLGDNISRDNISRSTFDNISRDNVSRSTVDNISRDNMSHASSRIPAHDEYLRYSNDDNYQNPQPGPSNYDIPGGSKVSRTNEEGVPYSPYVHEVAPVPTPVGYNKVPHNGYYQENMARYGRPSSLDQYAHLYHFPPVYYDNNPSNLNYSSSFNFPPNHAAQIPPKRSESFRVGNQELIDELKKRQNKKQNGGIPPPPPPVPEMNGIPPTSEDNPYQAQEHDEVFN